MSIYLIQNGMYIGTDIFKIGMTEQGCDNNGVPLRMSGYWHPKIIKVWKLYLDDSLINIKVKEVEKDIIILFKYKYKLYKGNEWFEGNIEMMETDIDDIIDMYRSKNKYCQISCNLRKYIDNIKDDKFQTLKDAYDRIKDEVLFRKKQFESEKISYIKNITLHNLQKNYTNTIRNCEQTLSYVNLEGRLKQDYNKDKKIIDEDDKWCYREFRNIKKKLNYLSDIKFKIYEEIKINGI